MSRWWKIERHWLNSETKVDFVRVKKKRGYRAGKDKGAIIHGPSMRRFDKSVGTTTLAVSF